MLPFPRADMRFKLLGTPKSHQSRTVPLPRFVAVELAAGVDGKRPDDPVFTMPDGSVMRLSNWRHVTLLPARARARRSGSACLSAGQPVHQVVWE